MTKYDYEISDKTFVNPYHFIPLENECKREIKYIDRREQNDVKTGWIECELKTLTPIFIPNTTNDDFFKERKKDKKNKEVTIKSYDFFSYQDNSKNAEPTDKAVIPGSSIRGVIRSAFEALTNSCMSTTHDNQVLYKRVTKAACPGRLVKKNDEWWIVKCEKYGILNRRLRDKYLEKTDGSRKRIYDSSKSVILPDSYNNNDEVYIKIGQEYPKIKKGYFNRKSGKKEKNDTIRLILFKEVEKIEQTKTSECTIKGYLHKGEPFGRRKHHESVFVEKNNRLKITEHDVKNLLENYRLYQDETVNLHKKQKEHNGYDSNIKNAKNKTIDSLNGALIYYAEHNGKYYLSPAAIGREVFHNRLTNLLNTYSPCKSHDNLCPACALFGFAGNKPENDTNNSKNAIASRVCFSDAKTDESRFLDPVILPELAGPKPSSTELYMKKPQGRDVAMWNYDYVKFKQNKEPWELKNYTPQIQGRKFYWHHENMKTFDNENNNRNFSKKIPYSDRLVKIRPIDKNVKFTFKIHFNQLAKDELDKLLWTLSIGDNNDLAHKIGMGKPVGLGSVQIKINKVTLRKLSIENGSFVYNTKCEYKYGFNNISLGCNDNIKKAFEKITDFKNKPKNIHYPYCIDESNKAIPENYEWFVGNKQINGVGTGTSHVISEYLKSIDSDPALSVIKKKKKRS